MPLVKYKRQDLIRILNAFLDYIDVTEMPIIAEFAYQNDITDQNLRDFQNRKEHVKVKRGTVIYDFSLAYKKALLKQQAHLVRTSMKPGQNAASFIFLLKALHNFSDQADQKPQETHIHVHQQAEKVKKLEDQAISTFIQQELLKPQSKKKPKSPRN